MKHVFKRDLIKLFSWIIPLFLIISCEKEPNPEPALKDPEEEAVLDESIRAAVPRIIINIENGAEVIEKATYLNATIEIQGNDLYEDMPPIKTRIKGRGNSTWGKPKKPYRLKLDTKTSILGLPKAKDWVLLANYQDYTLMSNAVAMKIGQLLNMPYTHTIIPVDVIINGELRGSYTLTEQVEIAENRVDIGKNGFLLELDTYFDEDTKFASEVLNLPVMVKDPDVDSEQHFNAIKTSFQSLENLLFAPDFPINNYGNLIDKKALVNYLILNNLVANYEINHPKSVYMFKPDGGMFIMGPIWDFDWAFGIDENTKRYFTFADIPLLKEEDERKGAKFFSQFMKDPEIRALYKQIWTEFRNESFNEVLKYVEWYAASIRDSQKQDYAIWKIGDNNLPQSKADMKNFLRKRGEHIDEYVAGF